MTTHLTYDNGETKALVNKLFDQEAELRQLRDQIARMEETLRQAQEQLRQSRQLLQHHVVDKRAAV
jgi:hypothetical protein